MAADGVEAVEKIETRKMKVEEAREFRDWRWRAGKMDGDCGKEQRGTNTGS